jgi:hypothetical protein
MRVVTVWEWWQSGRRDGEVLVTVVTGDSGDACNNGDSGDRTGDSAGDSVGDSADDSARAWEYCPDSTGESAGGSAASGTVLVQVVTVLVKVVTVYSSGESCGDTGDSARVPVVTVVQC